jgi:hypothetical protein
LENSVGSGRWSITIVEKSCVATEKNVRDSSVSMLLFMDDSPFEIGRQISGRTIRASGEIRNSGVAQTRLTRLTRIIGNPRLSKRGGLGKNSAFLHRKIMKIRYVAI